MSTLAIRILGAAIIVMGFAYYLLDRYIKKQNGKLRAIKNKKSLKGIFWLYRIYSEAPLLKRYYEKISINLKINYPADDISIKHKATVEMSKCVGASLALIVLIIIMARGDWFFICMGIFVTYFLFTFMISSTKESLDKKLLLQLKDFITNLRHHYSINNNNVEDAVYDTMDETPYEMTLHASKIHKILTATNVEYEVAQYVDAAPNNYILMLVAICATIKEYGDKQLDNNQSLFLTNINYLKEEINVELIRRRIVSFLFSGLTTLALMPLLFLKAIEAWGVANIPEMSSFYSGSAGTTMMAIIFIITVLIYQLIINLKDGHSEDMREHKVVNKILSVGVVNKLVTIEINRNYTKHLKIDEDLKMVGNRIGVKGFLIKRILFGLLAVLLINIVIFTSEWRTRYNILNDFTKSFTSTIVPNEEYRESMREAAIEFTLYCRDMKDTEENRSMVAAEIAQRTGLKEKFVNEVVREVFKRIARYKDVYYRWWFMLINIVGFSVGFMLPYGMLQYQLRVVKMDMEDEVLQFQTIVLILMHVDGMMIDTVLEWVERFSYCFKQSVSECIINLEYSSQRALTKMKNQETFPSFRRFVDNLLMIEDEDIQTAFSEIETDREYYKEKRKTDNEIITTRKAEIGKIIAFIPLIVTLLGYMIIPFAMFALQMIRSVGY